MGLQQLQPMLLFPLVGLGLPTMGSLRDTRRFGREWTTLLCVLLVGLAGRLDSLSSAQTVCGEARTTPIRVQNATGLAVLQAAASCAGGGEVEADWAGNITLDSPIEVAEGTFLSVTGEDSLAEAHGDSLSGNGTRLFEVLAGGGLTLTQLRLSGGKATYGGAIHSESASLTLDNCTLQGNTAPDGNGGAVWASGGNVTIIIGKFLSNWATNYGGAVYAIEGTLLVQGGASFEKNEAVVGGGLFCGLEEVGSGKPVVLCSITDAEFVSNADVRDNNDDVDMSYLDGGGAAAFMYATVNITNSVFNRNEAQLAGGAVHAGEETTVEVNGCTFDNNTSEKFGGAISASVMTVGGDTLFKSNTALQDGAAVFGWDIHGSITFNDVNCSENVATRWGGCFFGAGSNVFNDGTVMLANQAEKGGCIFMYAKSNATIAGGEYRCESDALGGFLFAEGDTRVRITAGLFAGNVAGENGGAVYCDGDDGASDIAIEGGTFSNNEAKWSGGAIALWGEGVVVTVTGGTFANNTATFSGGFIYIHEEGSIVCEGTTIEDNFAGDQGGGIYARQATWVNSSCDLVSNESPQAAAIYLTNVNSATFENHYVLDNLASAGSVVYVAASTVVARDVRFSSSVGVQEYSFNRAVQLDADTTFDAEGCVFDGWQGDTVIFSTNPANGSLVLDSCDFSDSAATTVVISPNSDAEIRNAVVSSTTFDNARDGMLVDRALNCSASNACGAGNCVDSELGVLCECLEGGECLNDGGELSLSVKAHPSKATFSPDEVSYELEVSSLGDGTTNAIWEMVVDGGGLDIKLFPSSGVLYRGESVAVKVTGTSMDQDVSGNLESIFHLMSAGSASLGFVDNQTVISAFYLCPAFEYAGPPTDADTATDDGSPSCTQCAAIEGAEGVDCTDPGATLTSLPIRKGFWRSSDESLVVHECLHHDACAGASTITTSDDYCERGYRGPYCAVCSDGYGSGTGNSCHYCDNTKAHLLIAMAAFFALVVLVLLVLAVVFLIGGLDAIDIVRETVGRKFSVGSKASSTGPVVSESRSQERSRSEADTKVDSVEDTLAPAFSFTPALNRGASIGESASGRRVFPITFSDTEEHERSLHRTGATNASVGAAVGAAVGLPGETGGTGFARESARRQAQLASNAGTGSGAGEAQTKRSAEAVASDGGKSKGGGIGAKIKRCFSRLPMDKLKILVVVWQILAVFSSITGVEFPASYAKFLSWISVVNLDIGSIFSASCILPSINFYANLLVVTLAPLVLAGVLVLTHKTAKKRAGVGSAGVVASRAAWSRHVAAGLLLTFLVFTSASTIAFKTFACDEEAVDGESFLRADYSLSCKTSLHIFFQVYAAVMILVYPIGIPVLYAATLWKNRELLNPRIRTEPVDLDETSARSGSARGTPTPAVIVSRTPKGQTKTSYSPEELKKLEEKVKARKSNPELVPSMFLWKDFGPDLYYYEVIECGRRILLTGVLIFIAPQSATQAAMACIFAFASLLGFELLRPHMDPTDSWLYRLGCVIIFLSNFLALLIKVDAGEESNRAAFGAVLIAVNVMLVLAVLVTSWFATQQSVDDHREGDTALATAQTMLTAEQYAARSARLSRLGSSTIPTNSSSAAPDFHPAGRSAFGSDVSFSEGPAQGGGASDVASEVIRENTEPNLRRGRSVGAVAVERLPHPHRNSPLVTRESCHV